MVSMKKATRLVFGAFGLLVGLLMGGGTLALSADIVKNETVSPGDYFYGIDASSAVFPFVSIDNYFLTASGDTTRTFDDTDFDAAGIYSSAEGTIETLGNISLLATGGDAMSGDADATAWIWVKGISSQGPVSNSGVINVTSQGGTASAIDWAETGAEAWGIDADGTVDSNGPITVSIQGGTATATEWADAEVYAYGIDADGTVDSNGPITVSLQGGTATAADWAYAVAEAWGVDATGSIDNGGIITVSSQGGNSSAEFGDADSYAEGHGIEAEGDVTNSGGIDVTSQGGTATAAEWADSEACAWGINTKGTVVNNGAITVSSQGGNSTSESSYADSYAEGHGIEAEGDVTNSGVVTVSTRGGTGISASGSNSWVYAEAFGIVSEGDISNSGSVIVKSTGGTVTADSSTPYALAIGLQTDDVTNTGNITNTGDVTVTATCGTGTGTNLFSSPVGEIHAGAGGIVSSGGVVSNSANIVVIANAPDTFDTAAIGIAFLHDGTLTNTGIIRASADRAYEVGVMSGTVTLREAYNLNLDGNPSVGSLFVNDGAILDLNGAALRVTSVGESFSLNTEYRIFETEGFGVVNGEFGEISAINPNVAVLYFDQDSDGCVDDTVSVSYQPKASPRLEGVTLLRHSLNLASDLLGQHLMTSFLQISVAPAASKIYAAAETVVNDAGWYSGPAYRGNFFFTPYFANVDKDPDPAGHEADMVGFVTGLERQKKGNLYGFHLGFNHAAIDFTGHGFSHNQEDQELFSAGVHLMGSRNNWTWRSQLSGFYGWHNYDGLTGLGLEISEDADYNSYGMRAAVLVGHMFRKGGQILLPEAGMEYLWLHGESFTTDADNPDWAMHSDSLDEHQVSAVLSLRWSTRLQRGNIEVTPSLTAGLRYLLTDDELDVHQSIAGSGPVAVKSEQDDVTGTVSASVRLGKEGLSTELAYAGEFGDDTTQHSVWVRFNYLY